MANAALDSFAKAYRHALEDQDSGKALDVRNYLYPLPFKMQKSASYEVSRF